MELYRKGNLASYLRKRKIIDQAIVFNIMNQLINAVEFLHEKKIVHRDLKP